MITSSYAPNNFNRLAIAIAGVFIAWLFLVTSADGQIDGFTEPYRSIELSSDESGAIASLDVHEGQFVHEDDVIARLDVRVQRIQLEIATHLSETKSHVFAAEEALKKRQAISQHLIKLRSNGHASQSEIVRAQMELSIAQAELMEAQEEHAVYEIEKRRAQVQLDRRTIFAPFDGVIAKIHRREGEFLSPIHPEVVTIIQADRLLATFAIPSTQLSKFEIGKQFTLVIGNEKTVVATVSRIGVQTDARSGTVEVKLVIDNPTLEFRSGESCTLKLR